MQRLEGAAGSASGISLPRLGASSCAVIDGASPFPAHSEGASPPAAWISVCCSAA